jgi:hypothetical protein
MNVISETTERPRVGRLLVGYDEIGSYLGLTERQAEYQAEANGMPVIRLGKRRVAARPERLDAWLDDLEQRQA